MANTEREKLLEETNRWLKKLENEMKKIEITGKMDQKMIKGVVENINAYISDCKHFLSKDDRVNAYEAVIYAWGIYETALRVGILRKK